MNFCVRKGSLINGQKFQRRQQYKHGMSFFPIFNIIAILSISGMQFGYGLCEITTIYNQRHLMLAYDIDLPKGLGLGLLVGLMPIGGFTGNILGKCIISRVSIKMCHHFINILCMISSFALMQITLTGTIFAGRFLYGFCIACYCSWSPRYIQQLAPINLKTFVKSIYGIWVMGAIMLGYFFGVIFYETNVSNYYRIMFCFPGLMAVVQFVLMCLFVPHSPAELFQEQQYEEGRRILRLIYKQEFVDMMVDRFKLQAQVKALRELNRFQDQILPYRQGRLRARLMGIYLNTFRELVGITTLLVYAGFFIGKGNYRLGSYTNFILSIIALVGTVFSHLFFTERCARKQLIIISTLIFVVSNIMIMIGMITNNTSLTFAFMIVFIMAFGFTYSIVSSIYPAEILKNQRLSYTSLISWPAMVLVTLVPPVVTDVMEPSHAPWPIFLFFGVYALLSTLYLWCCAVESKNREYNDILKSF